jgi:hypothetical protein
MLDQFGEFPEKYRLLTWKHLLQLPLSQSSFQALVAKGTHPSFQNMPSNLSTSGKIKQKMQRLLSCLSYWCPLASQVDYLPYALLPLAKVISDDLVLFEISMSFIVHWM